MWSRDGLDSLFFVLVLCFKLKPWLWELHTAEEELPACLGWETPPLPPAERSPGSRATADNI